MSTPSIPGVDREVLADVIREATWPLPWAKADAAADAILAHIAAHHECACEHDHADEWVEVDEDTFYDLPVGARMRLEWRMGAPVDRFFVHRDDLPDAGDHGHTVCRLPEADDGWVEVDKTTWDGLPDGVRMRLEWRMGAPVDRYLVRRDDLPDDLPDDPRALIARELGPARADTFLGLLDEHGWTVTRKGER